ncbi:MAG: dihydrolipoyl dehydrogenase [Rickettsiaceae bacterium]|nr:MAG: dihydrolipoyl dehydrogenase [Rickettsiaceae bacterium]
MSPKTFEIIVIGGGPGGYVAAIRAAQLGKKVAVVEMEHLGGVCLNWGCIPTKALLKSAEMFEKIKQADNFGIKVSAIEFDIKKIVQRSRDISNKLSKGVKSLLDKNNITLIKGVASFHTNKILNIVHDNQEQLIAADNIIIATGAKTRILNGFEPDGHLIWTSKEAMIPENLPKSLLIIGSGAIGIEFASFYNALGTEVTILEKQNRILSAEDEEISTIARKIFEKKGIKIHTGVKLLQQTKHQDNIEIKVEIEGQLKIFKTEKLLIAAGIIANTEQLNLKNTEIKLQQGHIETNEFLQTSESHIYAIGDVVGAPWLAHKASHEAIIAVEHILGIAGAALKKENIPGCTYSLPQIASVGITEEVAKLRRIDIKVGRFPFAANGKALAIGEPEGLVKTIFDAKTGEMLGAHMIGPEVTELIQGYVIAKNMEGTELDIINAIFPHPTLSETMLESVLAAYKRQIHI